ncbi:MAG: DUF2889 domain-containing protein [Betaproteobacteria bacterium]|nr:DUF2889 domain-containing protein [Betaproteobacteria bacterium]
MSLPEPASGRRRLHTRRVEMEGFLRDDGLLDLEISLLDVKDVDLKMLAGDRLAGVPIHKMRIRLTIDMRFNIKAAAAETPGVPYVGHCEAIAPVYEKLVGLNLFNGFRKATKDLVGGVHGCTHLTEMLPLFPTLAMQTMTSMISEDSGTHKPFQLDRCHALDSSGEVVRRYYPKWFKAHPEENA